MTSVSWVLLVVACAAAVLDWAAVARESAVLEYVSKPTATVALLATALSFEVVHDATWAWRIAALAFCVLGDVFLMLPRDAFVPGLASFAVAQVLLAISFVSDEVHVGRLVVGLVVTVPVAVLLARRFVSAIKRAGRAELAAPIVIYLVVISAMAVTSIAAGAVVAVVGALFFMLSDSLIAESRFVKERKWHGVGIMVTYHAALVGLVLGLL